MKIYVHGESWRERYYHKSRLDLYWFALQHAPTEHSKK